MTLTPLTLLLGTNAGGKSSFIQALMLLQRALGDSEPLPDASTLLHRDANNQPATQMSITTVSYAGELTLRIFGDNPCQPVLTGEPQSLPVLHHLPAVRTLQTDELQQLQDSELAARVSHWLQRMGLADAIGTDPTQPGSLIVHQHGRHLPLLNMGTGIALVLPVLLAACRAQPGEMLLIEEPEAHLHPLAQSALAELFTEVAITHQVQIVMETHSEHLFRRLQTLMARGTLTAEQATLYFVEYDDAAQSPAIRQLYTDQLGRVVNWPQGFFGDALGETREQARLMLNRAREL